MIIERKLTRTERILEPFGANQASEIIKFFDMIASYDCDVVVFMARKSLCLYRMIQLCGAMPISVPIFSDTIFETNSDLLKGKRVLVVDDTLFVGTTLADASKKLNELDVSEVKFWVYCADVETWATKTFSPDYIHREMSEQEAIEFCAAECRALINAGIPYLTDFSASSRIRLTARQLDQIIRPVNWMFHDVSSQYHEVSKVKYYSGLPDQFVQEQVKNVFGQRIFDLIEIAKVRIFATWAGRGYDVTFVPLVTFAPCNVTALSEVSLSVARAFEISENVVSKQSETEKMRMVQFLVGAVLMKSVWDHVDKITAIDINLKHSHEWCRTVFIPEMSEQVSSSISKFYSNGLVNIHVEEDFPDLSTGEPDSVVEETVSDVDRFLDSYFSNCAEIDFGHSPLSDLTAIMLEFQGHFEKRARQEIIANDPNPKFRDRLKRGMAWRALCSRLLLRYSSENTRHHRNVLSLFLDRLVDFGVAVPIIAKVDGLVYRAYRHGEDVRFGAQEESLVHHLLDGFQNGRGVDGIEGTYLEKLLVILLRVGMNEEWLNLWYSNSPRDNLVRVGYHLQGAVPIAPRNDDELVPEGETSWLTRRLCKTGTISTLTDDAGKKQYGLGRKPVAAHARRDAPRTAKLLGHALGKACTFGGIARNLERPLGTEDLIILTSCSNKVDTTGAVAAELQLFSDWFREQGLRVLNADFQNANSPEFKLNVPRGHGVQAINSAIWTIDQFGKTVISEIRTKIADSGSSDPDFFTREDIWEAVFEAFDKRVGDAEGRKMDKFLDAALEICRGAEFLLSAVALVALIGREPRRIEHRSELRSLVGSFDFANFSFVEDLKSSVVQLDDDMPVMDAVAVSEAIATKLAVFGKSICLMAREEAQSAFSFVNRANTRLSRREYRYMVWYDILDVRVRNTNSPDEADRYQQATNKFRSQVSSYLDEFVHEIRENSGEVFVHSGDVRSINDEKHVFLAGRGSQATEANRLVADLVRISERTGVRLRIMAVPTNLRGEFVYVNRGQTDVGGDFMSHAHTLIQKIKHHPEEIRLDSGEVLTWVLSDHVKFFNGQGSVSLSSATDVDPVAVSVEIRKMTSENTLVALR